MCIFHDVLSDDSGFDLAPAIVALSALQKGSPLFSELATLLSSPEAPSVSESARALATIARDPYRFLRTLLSFEVNAGHGECALRALRGELAADAPKHFSDPTPCSPRTAALLAAESAEDLLQMVAIHGHQHRPAFLEWFRDNPAGEAAPRAIAVLDRVAAQMLAAPRLSPPLPVTGEPAGVVPTIPPSERLCCNRPNP